MLCCFVLLRRKNQATPKWHTTDCVHHNCNVLLGYTPNTVATNYSNFKVSYN